MSRGELSKEEKERLVPVLERAARYGLPLQLHSPDPRQLPRLDDVVEWMNKTIEMLENDLKRDHRKRLLENMSREEQERLLVLYQTPEDELAKIGLTKEEVDHMLPELDPSSLDEAELEDLMTRNDHERARLLLKTGMIDPFDTSPLPKPEQKDEYLAKIFELEQKFTEDRHAFSQALRLQNERGRWFGLGHEMGKEYLERVKKELGE